MVSLSLVDFFCNYSIQSKPVIKRMNELFKGAFCDCGSENNLARSLTEKERKRSVNIKMHYVC